MNPYSRTQKYPQISTQCPLIKPHLSYYPCTPPNHPKHIRTHKDKWIRETTADDYIGLYMEFSTISTSLSCRYIAGERIIVVCRFVLSKQRYYWTERRNWVTRTNVACSLLYNTILIHFVGLTRRHLGWCDSNDSRIKLTWVYTPFVSLWLKVRGPLSHC